MIFFKKHLSCEICGIVYVAPKNGDDALYPNFCPEHRKAPVSLYRRKENVKIWIDANWEIVEKIMLEKQKEREIAANTAFNAYANTNNASSNMLNALGGAAIQKNGLFGLWR